MMPGSTTVHYTDWKEMTPNKMMLTVSTKNQQRLILQEHWLGKTGLFAAAFDQDDRWGSRRFEPTNLSFCKSVFAVDGMLYSLGTDIEGERRLFG